MLTSWQILAPRDGFIARAKAFADAWDAWEGSEVGAKCRGDHLLRTDSGKQAISSFTVEELYGILVTADRTSDVYKTVVLHLLGGYAPEPLHAPLLQQGLFEEAVKRIKRIVLEHGMPSGHDTAGGCALLNESLKREDCEDLLSQDPELKPWSVNRFACTGLGILLMPEFLKHYEVYEAWGIGSLKPKHAAKALKELHSVARLLHLSYLDYRAGRQSADLAELAGCLYHQCLLGRNDFGTSIVEEALSRSAKLPPRLALDKNLKRWTAEEDDEIERKELTMLWGRCVDLANIDDMVRFDGMSQHWTSALGTGFGKQTKLSYSEVLDPSLLDEGDSSSPALREVVAHLEDMRLYEKPIRAKRKT